MNTLTRRSLVIATAMVATAGLAGCSSGSSGTSGTSASASSAPAATTPQALATTADAASGLVGPGCAAYAAANPSGAASVAGMSTAPVAVAASGNPLLKTLTAAVSGKLNKDVNLVDTLDSSEFTVFAPVDSAFAKLPAKTVTALKMTKNKALLTKILTYHVVAGQLDPTAVVGTQKTVEGGSVKVTGSGDTLKVNGAHVVCGGVKTANATVYLIDGVLTPPKK